MTATEHVAERTASPTGHCTESRTVMDGHTTLAVRCPSERMAREEAFRRRKELDGVVYDRKYKVGFRHVFRVTLYGENLTINLYVGGCAPGSLCWAKEKLV